MSTQTLTSAGPTPPGARAGVPVSLRRRTRILLAVVLALAAVVGARTVFASDADVRDGADAVSAREFAARTGIEVTLLGVTAEGGMIEFRYRVVDPDRASLVLHDDTKRPVLVAEDSGATLAMLSRPHSHKAELTLGGTYFFLMANTNNALRDGTPVTVVIGDVRLEHLVART